MMKEEEEEEEEEEEGEERETVLYILYERGKLKSEKNNRSVGEEPTRPVS